MSWKNMTGREIKRIQEKDCKHCKNSIKISSIDSGCDYLAIHKKEDHASRENAGQQECLRKKKGEDMGSRIPVERQEVKKAKELYVAGYDVEEIALGLNRTRNTVRRMIHGFYDNLEPKKPKEKDKEKPLWKICFDIEWMNTVNKLRKTMGKEPI